MILGRGPVQIAYGVADPRASALRWAERGVGPFFLREHIPVVNARVLGRPAAFDHTSAYGWWGEVMVELIHQHDPGPEPVVPVGGVHHMAFFVGSFPSAAAELETQGFAERIYAETTDGMCFGMFDARGDHGHLLEIYEETERLSRFYAFVRRQAAAWDGSEPVRVL